MPEFRHESTAVTTIAFMMSADPGMPMVSSAAMKGESPSLVALSQRPLEPGVLNAGGRHGASLPGTVGCYTTPMEMRPATREEFDDFDHAVLAAFHREVTEEDRGARRSSEGSRPVRASA